LGWAEMGFGWEGRGAELGQKWSRRQRVVFFSKSIFPFVFKFYFADLKLIGGFKLF
jgi:hypothetical protein